MRFGIIIVVVVVVIVVIVLGYRGAFFVVDRGESIFGLLREWN